MARDEGGAAFPRPHSSYADSYGAIHRDHAEDGMSLRDYFAAKALQGMGGEDIHAVVFHVDNGGYVRDSAKGEAARLSAAAYVIADAMLEQRKK